MMFRFLLSISLLLFSLNVSATHLVGGSLRYEFLGIEPNGEYKYDIILDYYFNGDGSSSFPFSNPPPVQNMDVGIYVDPNFVTLGVTPFTPPGSAGDLIKYGSLDINLPWTSVSQFPYEPPSNCATGTNIIVYQVTYSNTITLSPVNPATGDTIYTGYHLIHERCCRNGGTAGNGGIDNIQDPGGAGLSYYAYIPPFGTQNSSPSFTNKPTTFICANDTTTTLNTAIDIDGDELLFTYITPLDGNWADGFNNNSNQIGGGGPSPGGNNWYPNNYPWPIETVTYEFGFNYAAPFGIGGLYNVVANNGLTTYYSNNLGKYVVAVMIQEIRNGITVGITTREIQLNVINCPPNPAPNLNPNAGDTATVFTLEEGENLCFDFGFFDPNSPPDSLILTASGQIFDSNLTSPAATIQTPVISNPNFADSVNTTFCWDTDCGQNQNLPYIFTVSVEDRGCPPKTLNVVYEINVTPTDPPANIYGDQVFCVNSFSTYTTDNNPTIANYDWNVNNKGNIIQDYGDSVLIQWISPGTGIVELRAENIHGCLSSPVSMNTTVTPGPTVDAGNNVSICIGDSVLLNGVTNANPGYLPNWQSTGPISNPNSIQTYVNPTDTTKYYLLIDIGGGCYGIDSVTVNVEIPDIDAGIDQTICLGDTVNLNATSSAQNFTWSPNNFIDQVNNNSTDAWPNATTQYIVEATTLNGCIDKDTVVVFVSPLPGSNANFILNAQATYLGNNEYRLTQAINSDTGAIWNSTLVNLNQPFHFDVDLYFGTNDADGADGIAFGLQQLSAQQLGYGGGIGYEGISPSFFVEFDTWQNSLNNDIPDDHIAIQKDGILNHSTINNLYPPQILGGGNIEDGLWHNTIFDWDPVNQIFTVEFDGIQIVNLNYDIINNIFGGVTATYWGFTASTGGFNNEQKVRYNNGTFFNEIIDQEICSLDSILISAPVDGDSYLWEPNNFIDDNTSETPIFSPTSSATYIFTATNSFGCFIKDTFNISINSLPNVFAGNDQDICIGDSTLLNASGTAINYVWNNGVNDGVLFEVINTQDYILTGTDGNSCVNSDTVTVNGLALPNTFTGEADGYINLCINDSVQLQGQGADNYLWSPVTFLSDPNIANPWAKPNTNTQYILTGTLNNGCTKNDTLQIDVNPLPNLSTGGDKTICYGDSIQIEAFGGINFNWISTDSISNQSVSNPLVWPSSTTIYEVLISDVNTCEDTAEVIVNVNLLPTVFAGNDQNICFGDSTQLNASGTAINYVWNNGVNDGVLFEVSSTQDYILTGVDGNSCVNTDTVTIFSLNLPNIDAGNSQSICIGDTTQINASGGDIYLWSPNSFISDININNPLVNPTSNIKYYVNGTDLNGCTNIDSVQINVDALPSINLSNDTSICIGDTINIVASGGNLYQWLNTDSISNINISNPDIWPVNTSIYNVLVTGANSCKDTGEINITVNPLPSVFAGNDQNICFGDSTQLIASGAVNYLWEPNSNISSTINNTTQVWPVDTSEYIVFGTDINQCVNSDTVQINILNLPIADAGDDLWVCPSFSKQLMATGGVSYTWEPDSTLNNGNIQNPIASPTFDETYIVTVTDNNNCSNKDTLFLEVQPNVPTNAGGDTLTICKGLTLVLGGSPTSPENTQYSWSPSIDLSFDTISNPIAQPLNPTWYTVLTNNDTCSGIDSVFVNFHPDIIDSAGIDQEICFGDTTSLIVSGINSYIWSPITNILGDTILINDTLTTPLVLPNDTTTFIVKITDVFGCIKYDSTKIDVNPLPNFDLGSNTSICIYDSLNLLASGGSNYLWEPNYNITNVNISNPTVYNYVDTTYYVTVTDSNSCINYDSITINVNSLPIVNASANDSIICFGSSTILLGTGAVFYQWTPSDSLSNPNFSFPNANPDSTTLYTLIGTDANGCSNTDSINITVNSLPTAYAGEDDTICPGTDIQLNGSGGTTYQWINPINLNNFLIQNPIASPDTITNYILQVTDSNGCINTDTVILYLFDPAIASAGFNVSICPNESTILSASGGVQYNWEPANYVNRPDTAIVLAFPDDDMNFIVEVTDSNGCIDFDTVQVLVFQAYTNQDTLICIGDTIQADIFGDPATSFNWSPSTGVSDASTYNPFLYPTVSTSYIVDIENAAGCLIQDTLFIEVPNPIASFDTTLNAGCNGVVVNYSNTSNSNLNINWVFSDGTTSTNNQIEKEFVFGQDFSATLNVEDEYGCTNTRTFSGTSLSFDDYFSIKKPNVFTPNGDGKNDQFIIEVPGKLYECTDLVIYNRWGQIQFISTGNNLTWDGRNNVGKIVPNGTYFYTISIKDKSYNGSISIYK